MKPFWFVGLVLLLSPLVFGHDWILSGERRPQTVLDWTVFCKDDRADGMVYACDVQGTLLRYERDTAYVFLAGAPNQGPACLNLNKLGPVPLLKLEPAAPWTGNRYSGRLLPLDQYDIRQNQLVQVCYDGVAMILMPLIQGRIMGCLDFVTPSKGITYPAFSCEDSA